MRSGSAPDLDPATIAAWIAATYGIDIAHSVAMVAAAELSTAARHARLFASDGANADCIDFFDTLTTFADNEL